MFSLTLPTSLWPRPPLVSPAAVVLLASIIISYQENCSCSAAKRCPINVNFNSADASQIVIISESAAVTADTTAVFACVAYGVPAPSISWSRGGSTLSNNSRFTIYEELVTEGGVTFSQSILEICSVGQDDAVQYTCSATNSVGTDTASFNLTVNRMFS